MADAKECEKKLDSLNLSHHGNKTFSDMPETLMREVCLYLPGIKLHHNVRNASKELRSVVNDLNVKLVGSFVVKIEKAGTHILSVYSKGKKMSMSTSKLELTLPKDWIPSNHPAYFKAAYKGSFIKKKGEGIFEYQSDKKDWKIVEEPPEQFYSYSIEWISPNVLVCIGMMMAYMPSQNWTGVACKVQILNLDAKEPKWHCPPVYRDNPLGPAIQHPYLFNTANGTIIMCGGHNDDDKDTYNGTYRGVLSDNRDIIRWITLDAMPNKQCFGASFKLKNKLYIMGGMNGNGGMRVAVEWLKSTLVFDVKRETWSKGPELPCLLEFPKGFTDSKEENAFIYGNVPTRKEEHYTEEGKKDRVMLSFNEESGFQKVDDIPQFPVNKWNDWDVLHTIE